MHGLKVHIDVRTATAADAELLAQLGARTFREAFGADNIPSDMDAYISAAFGPDIQTRELADPASVFLIAQVGAEAVGYAQLRFGDAPEAVAGERVVEIGRCYADTDWLGKGVGAALMAACLGMASERGCDVVWLDVWERNPRAIAFYAKWGFTVVGEQDFVLGDDVQHDLLMARAVIGADLDELRRLEESLWQPETRQSEEWMGGLLADGFVEFGASGRIYDRRSTIFPTAGSLDAELPLPGLSIRLLAPTVALVTYLSVQELPGDVVRRARRSSVWTLTEVGWKLVFHQGTLVK